MMPVRIVRLEGLAGAQGDIVLGTESESGKRGKEHHDPGVHDVAAVTPAIAGDQPHEAHRHALAVNRAARSDTFVELLQDGSGNEATERVRDKGVAIAHA